MTTRLHGRVGWSGGRDDEGYLEYTVKHMVECSVNDGPAAILATAGLPLIGSSWSFGDDSDTSVWCGTYAKVEYHGGEENDPHQWWTVEQKFSNKITEGGRLKTCLDDTFDNPLLEPQKVSGSYLQKPVKAYYDKNGTFLVYSTGEPIQGDLLMFDETKATVKIEQNVAVLDLSGVGAKMNRVNAAPLWGVAARCVKLSRFSWERKLWGTCSWYYTRSFEFDIDLGDLNPAGIVGFDRGIKNMSQKALTGKWRDDGAGLYYEVKDAAAGVLPDVTDYNNYSRYTDPKGELAVTQIDGATGLPANATWNGADGTPGGTAGAATTITVQKYKEANFLLLGIPTTF